jgi:hypothetical protein
MPVLRPYLPAGRHKGLYYMCLENVCNKFSSGSTFVPPDESPLNRIYGLSLYPLAYSLLPVVF